jgi:hypothetical protein
LELHCLEQHNLEMRRLSTTHYSMRAPSKTRQTVLPVQGSTTGTKTRHNRLPLQRIVLLGCRKPRDGRLK